MLKKSLSLLLGFILLVSTIPTTIFADSASLSALPEEMLNDIIDDGELVLADFSNLSSAEQELANLVTISSADDATASISKEHLMSNGATSALKLSNLSYNSTSQTGSSFYIKSKYDTSVLPSSYSIRIYFGIKDDLDETDDQVKIKFWSEIQNDGSWDTDDGFTFTISDKTTGGHHAINRFYTGSAAKQSWDKYNAECDGPLQFGLHVRAALTGDNNTVYIEKITAALQYTTSELAAPTATVADGGVYTISDSYNPHSFALDFAEDVYMAPDAVTVKAGDSDITEKVNPTLSGNTLNLTFPSDIDYTEDYKISLAKSKVRGATGKTLSADAVYNFKWNVVKMPLFTDGKLVLADFTNNPTEEYINSVITNASSDVISISSSDFHYSENAVSSLEITATSDGVFYIKSPYGKDLWPDEYTVNMKFGIKDDVNNIRFVAFAGLGDGADATYANEGTLTKGYTLRTSNDSHKEGLIRDIATNGQINKISSFENDVTIKFEICNVSDTCNAEKLYPGNNKFYIEQIYVEADCQPLSYPTPSVAYGTDVTELDEYTLSFGTELHYGEDALTLYRGGNVIASDDYTVLLKENDLVVKFKSELEDGIYKVVVDSDKILAKNGDVLYGDAEYAFSVNTSDSALAKYYIGTIGTSADYKTARVPVLGTVGENEIKFLAAVYNSDGSLENLHTDDLKDGELKFDSLTLSSTQTVKYMLLKDMDTIVPLCESVSNK